MNFIEVATFRSVNKIKHTGRKRSDRARLIDFAWPSTKSVSLNFGQKVWNQYLCLNKIMKLIFLKGDYWVLNTTTLIWNKAEKLIASE